MAIHQTRKRKSGEMTATPAGSPVHKKLKITQAQKQALMDNLQLEVTERARHLRAHYALQCTDLRARIERRINRIPISLRKANMGELHEKYLAVTLGKPSAAVAAESLAKSQHPTQVPPSDIHNRPLPPLPQSQSNKSSSPERIYATQPHSARGKKRKSEAIVIASDKENEPSGEASDTLPVAKNSKRVKTAAAAHQVSKSTNQTNVLSPRSHNSRNLPRSPIKEGGKLPSSPPKQSYVARPASPLKPTSPFKSAASAATSAISASIHGMVEHAKRGTATTAGKLSRTASREKMTTTTATKGKMPPPGRPATAGAASERTVSQSSNHSTTSATSGTSTTTTVVKKPGKTTTTVRQTVTTTSKKVGAPPPAGGLKKSAPAAAANKKVVVAEPANGRRVLRKRN